MAQKKWILSIDGGGIRGLIAANVLAQLEKDLPKPLYDTFDVYAGSSVGSWIVLAISSLQYTASQMLSFFTKENMQQVFSKQFLGFLHLVHGPQYKGEGKRAVVNELFGDRRFLSIEKQVLITAYDIGSNQAVVFKSQGHSSDAAYNPTIAEVADVSSAAPTYFPPVKSSDEPPRWLVDGGLIANDPVLCVITEMLSNGVSLEDIKVLSIGSGIADQFTNPLKYGEASQRWGDIQWLRHGLINDFFSGNTTCTEYQATQLLGNRYLRINDLLPSLEAPLDNIDYYNLEALATRGRTWYQQNRTALLDWLAI
jgi:patatin-like phospholipase/acyl hydrolase